MRISAPIPRGRATSTAGRQASRSPARAARITHSPCPTVTSTSAPTARRRRVHAMARSGRPPCPRLETTRSSWRGCVIPCNSDYANAKNVCWNGTFTCTTPGTTFNWQWGAACYNNSTPQYGAIGVKACHQTPCGYNSNSGDHAGTPENQKPSCVAAARAAAARIGPVHGATPVPALSRRATSPDISYLAPFWLGSTGDPPVPVGDSPTGTESDGLEL